MHHRGFTLLELLAVVALISIAMTVLVAGIPRGFSSMREQRVINELMQALRQAHTLAMVEQRPVNVGLDVSSLCYQLDARKPQCLPTGYAISGQVASGKLNLTPGFMFHPDGSSSGGNLLIRTPMRTLRIDVSWLTGNASVVQL